MGELVGSDLLKIGQVLVITVPLKIIHARFASHHTSQSTHVHALKQIVNQSEDDACY